MIRSNTEPGPSNRQCLWLWYLDRAKQGRSHFNYAIGAKALSNNLIQSDTFACTWSMPMQIPSKYIIPINYSKRINNQIIQWLHDPLYKAYNTQTRSGSGPSWGCSLLLGHCICPALPAGLAQGMVALALPAPVIQVFDGFNAIHTHWTLYLKLYDYQILSVLRLHALLLSCPWIMLDSLPSCLALSISTSLTRPQGWARLRYLGERCKPKQVPAKAKAKLLLDAFRFSS